jgi:hypothetical protein
MAADIFKVSTEYAIGDDTYGVPFTVPGQENLRYPYTNAPLEAGSEVVFEGVVTFDYDYQDVTVSLWATADSCAGDEFMPDYCRVEESDEDNNESTSILVAKLNSVADASIYNLSPTNNYGSEYQLTVGTGEDESSARALIRFNLSSIPAGTMIQNATLFVYLVEWGGGTSETDIGVVQVYAEWMETEVTWNNQPPTSWPEFRASTPVDGRSSGRYYGWDVTSLVQDWVNGTGNYGLMLFGDESVYWAAYMFYSRESVEVPPWLGIQYITLP